MSYQAASVGWAQAAARDRGRRTGRGRARLAFLQLAGLLARLISAEPPHPASAPRILVIQPDHLGDVLLASPSLQMLRAALPRAEMTYLVGPWSAGAGRHGPLAGSVETLAFPGFTRADASSPLAPYLLLARSASHLRRRHYDLAIVLRPDHWWGAMLAAFAGVPLRVGFRTLETGPFLSHALEPRPGLHATQRALSVVQFALELLRLPPLEGAWQDGLSFQLSAAEREEARLRFPSLVSGDRKPTIALHASAGAPLKRWPVERWAAVGDALSRAGYRVFLTGGPEDEELVEALQKLMQTTVSGVAVGQSLGITGALFQMCSAFVGLDGGAGHLAAAVGTPAVRLYGPADQRVFGPWPPSPFQKILVVGDLACQPCGYLVDAPCGFSSEPPCLTEISVEVVVQAVRDVVELTEAAGPRS